MLNGVRKSAVIAAGVGVCLLWAARPAHAQVVRAFVGQTNEICGEFGEGAKEQLVGGSIGRSANTYLDFEIGGMVNRCLGGKVRPLAFVGMHLFPVAEVINRRLWVGGALNVDVDFMEMERSLAGNGDGTAYLFLRPEFAMRVRLFSMGRYRSNGDGTKSPDGAFFLESHVGYFQAKSLYVTVGISVNLNR